MENGGNDKCRARLESALPPDFVRPTEGAALQCFIRDKYVAKKVHDLHSMALDGTVLTSVSLLDLEAPLVPMLPLLHRRCRTRSSLT